MTLHVSCVTRKDMPPENVIHCDHGTKVPEEKNLENATIVANKDT